MTLNEAKYTGDELEKTAFQYCLLTDGVQCTYIEEISEPPLYFYTFYNPSTQIGTKNISDYQLFLIQLIKDFGGSEGTDSFDQSLKFMIDSSVTLCSDL